jgi:hypothetical protein
MRTLEEIQQEFITQAREFDTGRSIEDFHTYLRQHNLEHHLSETQIADRNMTSSGLNAMAMVSGIALPLTLGAMYGFHRIPYFTANINERIRRDIYPIFGLGRGELPETDVFGERYGPRYGAKMREISPKHALSGTNTKLMPQPPLDVNSDWLNFMRPAVMAGAGRDIAPRYAKVHPEAGGIKEFPEEQDTYL